MNSHARREGEMAPGMKRGVSFQQPKKRIADYKSEKGYVAKLIDVKTGGVLARSEPHISNGEGLKKWIMAEAQKLIARGKRVKAEVSVEFFDPNLMNDMANYLKPKPGAPRLDLLLADALSPKGAWVGPYVASATAGFVQAPGSSGYLPYYNSSEPHARKLLATRPSSR
jgi:hypothetical protein